MAVGMPGDAAEVSTTEFSPYLFGFIPVPEWLQRGADALSSMVRAMFDKRADRPACEVAPPDWADHTAASIDAVLSCATTNVDETTGRTRAEVRLVNNRGYPIQIGVPAGASYAWVDGQPEPVRELVRAVARQDVVWLMPGQLMTVGFEQPAARTLAVIPAELTAYTLVAGLAEKALSEDLGPLGALHVLKECAAWSGLPLDINPVDAELASVFRVAKDCFVGLAANQVRLLEIADAATGRRATASSVQKLAGKLRTLALAIKVVDHGADLIDIVADEYVNPDTDGIDGYATTIGLRSPDRAIPAEPLTRPDQGFEEATDNVASTIRSTVPGIACDEVIAFIGAVAKVHNFYSGPRGFTAEGYTCSEILEDNDLPVGHYTCTSPEGGSITWDRT